MDEATAVPNDVFTLLEQLYLAVDTLKGEQRVQAVAAIDNTAARLDLTEGLRRGGGDYFRALPNDRLRTMLRGALSELMLTEDTLAEALGFPRSPGGPDDPNGGGYNIGEHTATTLAHLARRMLLAKATVYETNSARLDELAKAAMRGVLAPPKYGTGIPDLVADGLDALSDVECTFDNVLLERIAERIRTTSWTEVAEKEKEQTT